MIRRTPTDLTHLIDELGKKQIKVGFFSHSKYPDGKPIAGVAMVQELGSVKQNIPSRKFMGPSLKNGAENYKKGIVRAFRQAADGGSLEVGLSAVGEVAAGDVKQGIIDVKSPPLKESTIAARARRHHAGKASDKPLVDTGQMLQAVTYVVEDKE